VTLGGGATHGPLLKAAHPVERATAEQELEESTHLVGGPDDVARGDHRGAKPWVIGQVYGL